MVTSVACALLPAIETSRVDVTHVLAEESAGSAAGARRSTSATWRAVIMGAQVAVACLLLVGAALLGQSFIALMHANRGFNPVNVLTARLDLPSRYQARDQLAFLDAAVAASNARGVVAVAAGNALPFVSQGGVAAFQMPSPTDPAITTAVQATSRVVGPGYLKAMGLR